MILFLDFDGVTHPQPCGDENVFCQLHLIEAVLRERELQGVHIVISSSWREYHGLEDMREFFSQDMQSRVIGVTPNLWDQALAPAFVRERECMAWLATNRPPGTPWLAIDDRPSWFQPNCPNLFLTDTVQGFQTTQTGPLRDMLVKRF
ncbi:HAD domain-containing protein [Rhodoferax sp. BLA1]|uniref:HAD domain-containing protein n=1 Tax=Rhodoferax sp. BLA1 TaxID=2576062 RepID=UPI0015D4609B|nr:HAD domain-containing protein [Rhodoferax sp. BLA1]